MDKIKVDYGRVTGKIKPMHAVNNVPCVPYDTNENNLFVKMQEARIPYARLHDTGGRYGGTRYVDINNIFPNFDADADNPESYDFAFTDRLLEEIIKYGMKPFFRLGPTIENFHFIKAYHIYPPADYGKWAKVCEMVIRHYNEGWADGFHHGIEYWEIWNEPDNMPDIEDNPMWKGTIEQFCEFYDVVSTHLKKCFPEIKVGGYGSCGFYAISAANYSKTANSSSRVDYFIDFLNIFLTYVAEHGKVLDFFSWHSYADITENVKYAEYAKKKLEKFGFGNAEIFLNEWNPGIEQKGRLKDASNIASGFCLMQKTSTDMCMYYDAQINTIYCGLFDFDRHDIHKAYYAFYAFGELYHLGEEVFNESSAKKVYTCAAKSGDTRALLVVNNNDVSVSLEIDGLSCKDAKVYILDEEHMYEKTEVIDNEIAMRANSIWFFKCE